METKHPGVGPVMACRLPPSGYTGQSLRPHLRRKVSGRVSPVAVDRDCTVLYRSAAALMAGLEIARPRKRPDPDRMGRWVGNLDAVAVSFVSPGPVWKIRPRRPARASLLESSSSTQFQEHRLQTGHQQGRRRHEGSRPAQPRFVPRTNHGAPRIFIALPSPAQTRHLMARRLTW